MCRLSTFCHELFAYDLVISDSFDVFYLELFLILSNSANFPISVEQTSFAIETVRDTQTTINAMQGAAKLLKQEHKKINLDEVEDMQDDLGGVFHVLSLLFLLILFIAIFVIFSLDIMITLSPTILLLLLLFLAFFFLYCFFLFFLS